MDFFNRLLRRGRSTQVDSSIKKSNNPLTYPKASEPFSDDLFQSPTSEYRGAPFWAWNNKLDKDQLLRQIDNFADMGMGGFHIHTRTGLDTEYLGEEYMEVLKACVDYAEKKNMLACLYDEDRWPSGPAGGRVIKDNPEHKIKHLLFTKHKYGTVDLGGIGAPSRADAARSEEGSMIAMFDIELDGNGNLVDYKLLSTGDEGKNMWYAYVEPNRGSSWFNGYTYVDSLSPKAMAKFLEVTHEVFKSKVGDRFGTVIPNVFTDEPQFTTKTRLSSPRAEEDVFMPWTMDLPDTFKSAYSSDLVAHIPELFWNLQDWKSSLARYQYHDHVTERFVTAFMDQLSTWCRSNNLILNGHMMEEPTLWQQTTAIGEAMRCYRNMDMPGMDLLLDRVEYNTAKQCVSVARQNGLRGALSEIYGVTHWYFTFEGHKGCGDWQAALGITFRVQHLTWVSMEGESKRDYPASIGYQSPWYREYPYIEDHFARVAVAMTRGHAVTRVAVIHPIESFWLAFGPNGSTDEQARRDTLFAELTNWLLQGLIDFDFISESLLPTQNARVVNKKLHVGSCAYDVVILPNLRTVRSSTLTVMNDFLQQGGNVIIAGSAPDLVDADATKIGPIFNGATNVFWEQHLILGALEACREIRVTTQADPGWNRLLYQMRQDADERYVFICNTDRNAGADTIVELKGSWLVKEMDTFTGKSAYINVSHSGGWTSFPHHFDGCGSILFRLSPEVSPYFKPTVLQPKTVEPSAAGQVTLKSVTLSEPNVLVLDYAQWRISENDTWSARTEVLRLENDIRSRFKLPLKGSAVAQPYTIPSSDRKPVATVLLRFVFSSAVALKSKQGEIQLALENASNTKITLNGTKISSSTTEIDKKYWVDEAISTVDLPVDIILRGENVLDLEFPFNILSSIERIYLLGNFTVSNSLPSPSIIGPLDTSTLTWGSTTTQSLPFYVGNITYTCTFTVPSTLSLPPSPSSSSSPHHHHYHHHRHHTPTKSHIILSIPHFSSPLLTVHNTSTSAKLGRIAFQPRTLDLGEWEEGTHEISITAFGNRYNSFGHFHLENGRTGDCGPELWRTQGDWWTDEYRVKDTGVLECPTVIIMPVTRDAEHEKTSRGSTSSAESWVDVPGDIGKEL